MTRAGLLVCLAALSALPARAAAPPPAEQWIVVCPEAFLGAITPLVQHRRAQGLRVHVVPPYAVDRLQPFLHRLCREHPGTSSILLAGGLNHVPTLRGSISRMKGEPTDVGYGCPGGGRLPTVAVGRFPARTADEVKAMVAKTLALERAGPGPWRRRLTVLAGIPAYNPVVDKLVETIAFARFDRLHPAWTGRAIYTAPQSRFCLPGRELRSQALSYLQEGQAAILYLGHSNAEGLYAGPTAAFLDREDWGKLKVGPGSVFLTFGCNGCQFAGRDGEGYGVHAMRNPTGPAAVLGSHGICFAAMVQLAADGVFEKALAGRLPTRFGDCWLAALQGVAKGRIDFLSYRMLDAVDGDSRIPQATQREEHLEMFVLLGDPALRLAQVPDDIEIEADPILAPGKPLLVRGKLPARLRNARVTLSLMRSPGSVPDDLEPVPLLGRDRVLLANHRRANRFTVVETMVTPRDGVFEARLEAPARLPWSRLTLRAYALSATEESLTVRTVTVQRPEESKP